MGWDGKGVVSFQLVTIGTLHAPCQAVTLATTEIMLKLSCSAVGFFRRGLSVLLPSGVRKESCIMNTSTLNSLSIGEIHLMEPHVRRTIIMLFLRKA
jgi:hypothetical protein